jgi:hypothetical protein
LCPSECRSRRKSLLEVCEKLVSWVVKDALLSEAAVLLVPCSSHFGVGCCWFRANSVRCDDVKRVGAIHSVFLPDPSTKGVRARVLDEAQDLVHSELCDSSWLADVVGCMSFSIVGGCKFRFRFAVALE